MTVKKQRTESENSRLKASNLIRGLYRGLLLREPADAEVSGWLSAYESGTGEAAIVASFISSDEYAERLTAEEQSVYLNPHKLLTAAVPLAHLLKSQPITIVDVGAQNLSDEDHIYGPVSKLAVPHKIIGFEPLDHRRQERLGSQGNENVVLLPAFIGDGATHSFHVNAPDSTSSLLPFNRGVTSRFSGLDHLITNSVEVVQTVTLDAALCDVGEVDFMKLDIQGAELLALKNATVTLAKTLIVHCEVSFAEIYEGQAFFSDVDTLMRKAGFDLVDLPNLCRYPIVGTKFPKSKDCLGWGDAVYFRKLQKGAAWRDLLIQSFFALAVYDKPTLALALAGELRAGPAEAYLDALEQVCK